MDSAGSEVTLRSYQQWMDEYEESHRHPLNQKIHKICVPLIMFSLLGLLRSLPVPASFGFVPHLNWASLVAGLCLMFYLWLNFKMFLGMLLQLLLMSFIIHQLAATPYLLSISVSIFSGAWIGQFIGHKVEGKKPSFFKDLIFLLIGPLWVNRFLYRKLGMIA